MSTHTATRGSWNPGKLRTLMDERGWGIRRLAREVSPENPEPARRQIHRHLSGSNAPSRVTRHRYCDALGVDRSSLDDDEEDDQVPLDVLLARRIAEIVNTTIAGSR